jgi:hypothetical protein
MYSKPTSAELDQAKQLYNDVNDYLKYLVDVIQEECDDTDDSDYEELDPSVSQFLNDYKEYVSSLPQVHKQLVNHDHDSSPSITSSKFRTRLWRYSQTYQTLQLPPPNLLGELKKFCEAKVDRNVQPSPSFSASLPTLDITNNEKLLTNEASPSVTLLKAQLNKYETEKEKNRIVIRIPNYSYDDEPIEEKKVVFVIKKSTALIAAPPTVVESPREQEPIKGEIEEKIHDEKSEVVEISEKVLSEKNTNKNAIDFDFLSKFVSINFFFFFFVIVYFERFF